MKTVRIILVLGLSALCHTAFSMNGDQNKVDIFATVAKDVKGALLFNMLDECSLLEKVRRLGQLRSVCRKWNEILHEGALLEPAIPRYMRPILCPLDARPNEVLMFDLFKRQSVWTCADFSERDREDMLYNVVFLLHKFSSLSPEMPLQGSLKMSGDSVNEIVEQQHRFPNILMLAEGSTAKGALQAMKLAQDAGLKYVYFPTSEEITAFFGRSPKERTDGLSFSDIMAHAFVLLLQTVEKSGEKIMIIIDDAENLLNDHARFDDSLSRAFRSFLNLGGQVSDKYMFVILTSRPADISEAVLPRCDTIIQLESE